MREVTFLRQNSDKWKRLEALLQRPHMADPDELAALFVEVSDDLSYARTFYGNGKTVQYLNGLVVSLHRQLYRNRKEERGRFLTFWTREVPLEVRAAHPAILVSFVIFSLAALIGAVSAHHDAHFLRLILGDAYVDMTLANIERGAPLAVYGQSSEGTMFFGITLNNVFVSFRAYGFGMLSSVGVGVLLLYNGIMLGAFFEFFHRHALLAEALRVVWIHGTLEIAAIIVAGGAGIVMGNGLLFPGTYTRAESFRRGARRGMKIVVGLVPVFVLAGFLESFVTRHTGMPLWLSLVIILLSLGFVIWYFILYPIRLTRAVTGAAPPARPASFLSPTPQLP